MSESVRGGLQVVLVDQNGRAVRAAGLAGFLRAAAPARARGRVTVALVADDVMRGLNLRYLGKDRPTDVLSFPAWAAEARRAKAAPGAGHVRTARGASAGRRAAAQPFLGDIAIATGVAKRQARDAGHSYVAELQMLALHGLLHLLGYDHENDDGTMARLEARLRRRAGLRVGVIERAVQP